MSLETATFIDDLDTSNPPSGDPKSQGDDHLRLLKSVLKNSIKRVSRAFYVPNTVAKSANYSVLAADDNKTIVCDTTSAFTLTLPTLASSDAGWCVYVLKTTTDANPVWIAPPSGTINGYTKVRRAVPNQVCKVLWTGTVFVAQRAFGVPIGSTIPFYGTALPPGTLWPDGTTFTAADYVELNTVLGGNTKPDARGRVEAGKDDMGGSAASRIGSVVTDSGTIVGATLGSTGGSSTHAITSAEMTVHNHGVTDGQHKHNQGTQLFSAPGPGGTKFSVPGGSSDPNAMDLASSNITINNAGSGSAHAMLQPTIIANKVLVSE